MKPADMEDVTAGDLLGAMHMFDALYRNDDDG